MMVGIESPTNEIVKQPGQQHDDSAAKPGCDDDGRGEFVAGHVAAFSSEVV